MSERPTRGVGTVQVSMESIHVGDEAIVETATHSQRKGTVTAVNVETGIATVTFEDCEVARVPLAALVQPAHPTTMNE